MPSALRIYYLHPLYAGSVPEWDAHLDRCATMGFDSVLIAPPFRTGKTKSLFLASDHNCTDPRIDGGDALAALSRYAASARARGLLPMLDLVIDQLDEEAVTDADISSWYKAGPAEDTPDPRLPPSQRGIATLASEASLSALSGWWSERLVSWIDVGICGFRCLHADRLPPALLHDLISNARKRAPDIRFLSSSSDHANAGSDLPKSVGFDLSLVNTQHWDFRSDWTWVEANGLGPTLPTIGTPEWPFGPRTANRLANKELAYRAAVRALRFASRLGDGWMMPMGFEFGARRAMDAIRDRPTDFMSLRDEAPHDLSSIIAEINDGIGARTVNAEHRPWRRITPARAPVAALLRPAVKATDAELLLINPSLAHAASIAAPTVLSAAALPGALLADPLGEPPVQPGDMLTLAPADVITFLVHPAPSIKSAVSPARRAAQQAAQAPRLAIECVTPSVDNGQFPVKRHVGESVTVAADIICDGHDHIAAALLWRPADQQDWHEVRMRLQGNDRWSGSFPLARLGRHYFTVVAWKDEFRNFAEELEKKHLAGLNVELELEEGRLLLEATLTQKPDPAEELKVLVKEVGASKGRQRLHLLLAANTAAIMHAADPRPFLVRHPISFPVEAERWAAGFGSWYEIFPRSQSGDPDRHGTFDDVIGRLPAIRDMGFDVLYFPPIHPIGSINRKGRNNATTAQPGDPGSPYAIGSAEGGHDALHPELGTFKDFARLIRAAEQHGLEIALDFAIQCAPDHPWLKQHRGWFKWRPDGSMRYAENPPKKYEDIVNVDFYAAQAIPGLWLALRDVILFWVKQGVRIFRVDNPHTKPFAFWEWMIRDVRTRHPDVIFLSEAFTRPKVMYRLAKIGFSQSYTYFTWRNEKHELQDYLIELAAGPAKEFFRPHFFVNTPDINPFFLQTSGRAGFLIRAALAGTLSGLFGVYNGFELCEGRGLPGREEYLDSEKYEIRAWDWNREGNIVREITMLNRIRRSNPALQTHLGLRFHHADNDQIICYSKTTSDRSNLVLVAVSLDPFTVQECDIEVPLWTWGLPDDATIDVDDLMDGRNIAWHGKTQRIRLDPEKLPFAIWRLNPPEGSLT